MKSDEPAGARKNLGEATVYTKHMYHAPYGENGPEGPAIVETVQGDFLYMNGKPVNTREHIEMIPEQHRGRALVWFDRKYGSEHVQEEVKQEKVQSEKPSLETVLAELAGQLKALRHEVNVIRGLEPPDPKMVQEARAKERELAAKRQKIEEPEILKQVGITG